jgi:hypothetical protein
MRWPSHPNTCKKGDLALHQIAHGDVPGFSGAHLQVSYTQNPCSAGFFDADVAMLFDVNFAMLFELACFMLCM